MAILSHCNREEFSWHVVRASYSPPDLPVTPRNNIFANYCDNLGFLFGKKCHLFAPVTGTKCTIETYCLSGLFCNSETVLSQKIQSL